MSGIPIDDCTGRRIAVVDIKLHLAGHRPKKDQEGSHSKELRKERVESQKKGPSTGRGGNRDGKLARHKTGTQKL